MNTTPDPVIAVARISDRLEELTAHLHEVSDDVADLAGMLATPTTATTVTPSTATPDLAGSQPTTPPLAPPTVTPPPSPWQHMPPQPFPQNRPFPQTPPFASPPQFTQTPQPGQAPQFVQAPPSSQPLLHYATTPRPPRSPRPRRPLTGEGGALGKILAFAGVAITLIGVVLLLILAAQAGLLRPEIRVGGGVALAAALAAAGLRAGRDRQRRTVAAAVFATGVVTALFCVLAAANIYHWLPVIAALILTGILAAGGFAVAGRWDNQALGVTVGLGLIALSPVLTGGITLTLIVFMLVYAAATLAVQLGRDWPVLFLVNTVATVLPLAALAATRLPDGQVAAYATALSAAFVLAAGSSLALLRTSSQPVQLALTGLIPLLALFAAAAVLSATVSTALLSGAAVVLLALTVAGPVLAGAGSDVRTIWLTGAIIAGLAAVAATGDGQLLTISVLGTALALGVGAHYVTSMATALRILGLIALATGLLALVEPASIQLLAADGLDGSSRIRLMVAALIALAAVAVLTAVWFPHTDTDSTRLVVIAGVAGLVLVNVFCVSAATAVTGGSLDGFRAGHLCATLIFVAAGAAALLWARTLAGAARTAVLSAGLLVIGAAVAKLFLFDLAALAGLFRVIAFIVVGLVLLGLGVAYAHRLDTRDEAPGMDPSAADPSGADPACKTQPQG
ncbi:hypothetical protein GOHSU_36_00310 [Gordonia hirsuta DSM 44140 = NBRC 16056]|uniref:DUF2339 domain-containing protein n=1 Tax=Gordonia hirsuta DSM 44140 = NBRC 16056 TaxID=1121927 RepID=L7LE07_9ACTN|nr:DUF2339 domain-containing protein [Gordonia hirsuta]GAC58288.1 hypothetical protein GOHSU_36_00310 [Gordonia hirsuta DSM 44140 = NBRC 16056]